MVAFDLAAPEVHMRRYESKFQAVITNLGNSFLKFDPRLASAAPGFARCLEIDRIHRI